MPRMYGAAREAVKRRAGRRRERAPREPATPCRGVGRKVCDISSLEAETNAGTLHAGEIKYRERGGLCRHALDGRLGKSAVSVRGRTRAGEPAGRPLDSRLHANAARDRSPVCAGSLRDRRRDRLERRAQIRDGSSGSRSKPADAWPMRFKVGCPCIRGSMVDASRSFSNRGDGYDPRFETFSPDRYACMAPGNPIGTLRMQPRPSGRRSGSHPSRWEPIASGWIAFGSRIRFACMCGAETICNPPHPVINRVCPSSLLLSGSSVHPRAPGKSAALCIFGRLALVSRASSDRRRGPGRCEWARGRR